MVGGSCEAKSGSVHGAQGPPSPAFSLILPLPLLPLKGLFFMMLLKVSYVLLRFSSIR